jgi:hypothetical protein
MWGHGSHKYGFESQEEKEMHSKEQSRQCRAGRVAQVVGRLPNKPKKGPEFKLKYCRTKMKTKKHVVVGAWTTCVHRRQNGHERKKGKVRKTGERGYGSKRLIKLGEESSTNVKNKFSFPLHHLLHLNELKKLIFSLSVI